MLEELKKVLTENEGFYPIGDGKNNNSNFKGVFNGNNKVIKNLYINRPDSIVGLFGACIIREENVTIKNLEISGRIIGNVAGGIIGSVTVTTTTQYNYNIENCVNNVNIEAQNAAGGIVGSKNSSEGDLIISNCTNNGIIKGGNYTGGIIGNAYSNVIVLNSCNNKDVYGGASEGYSGVGGIVGFGFNSLSIFNS